MGVRYSVLMLGLVGHLNIILMLEEILRCKNDNCTAAQYYLKTYAKKQSGGGGYYQQKGGGGGNKGGGGWGGKNQPASWNRR